MARDEDISELKESVDRLTRILADQERRHHQQMRWYRYVGFALVWVVVVTFSVGLISGQTATAQAPADAIGSLKERSKRLRNLADAMLKDVESSIHARKAARSRPSGDKAGDDPLKFKAQGAGGSMGAGGDPAAMLFAALALIQEALLAVPEMSQEMKKMSYDMHVMTGAMLEMNGKMGVMTLGIDSTMGRMGRMMPW